MEKLPLILVPESLSEAIASGNEQLLSVLAQTQRPGGMHYKAPRGHSESQFERDLWQFFPSKIHTGLMVHHPNRAQPYVPDFAYIDSTLNLHIDIEVDEPYTHDTRQPLHYIQAPKDEQRNQFFLQIGWVVVRFSEEQVVKSPMSCCKAIASVIATITSDNAVMNPFRQVPTLKPAKRWTFEQAQQMADQGYRETYLKPLPPAKVSEKSRRKGRSHNNAKRSPQPTAQLTFYCPACGEGPIRWQGHYIACPNCGYDAFTL